MKDLRTPRPATEPRDGPTRNFHEKYRKNTPRAEILDYRKIPPKHPENTEKIPPKYRENDRFGYFLVIFGVFSRGSRISARRVFLGIFGGNSGSGHLGAL